MNSTVDTMESSPHTSQQETAHITRVGVVGAGQMGAGIAEVCARAGRDVLIWEASLELLEAGENRITRSIDRAVAKGKISESERDEVIGHLGYTVDLADFADRQLVLEAIIENEEIKTNLFRQLDEIVTDPAAILASNTSSLPIMRIAAATKNPERVLGIHFFNPVPVLPLVEIVTTLVSPESQVNSARRFVEDTLGKVVVQAKDRSGFIVNFLLVPYLLAAIRMVGNKIATPEDIDAGMKYGCAYPMGPLELSDLVGLDTVKAIADAMYDEYKEPEYAPPSLLLRMVEAGRLGRKSGQGFYPYDNRGKRL